MLAIPRSLGVLWQHQYDKTVLYTPNGSTGLAAVYRPNGGVFRFRLTAGQWQGESDVRDRLVALVDGSGVRTGWRYYDDAERIVESFDANGTLISQTTIRGQIQTLVYADGTSGSTSGNGGFALDSAGNPTTNVLPAGLLLRVVDQNGRQLVFGYAAAKRLVKVTAASDVATRFNYDEPSGNCSNSCNKLTSVTYADGAKKEYWYDEPAHITSGTTTTGLITGVVDEGAVRYMTYRYDSNGRGIEEFSPGTDVNTARYQLLFDAGGTRTILVDPHGVSRVSDFQSTHGVLKLAGQSQPAGSGCAASSSQISYDANGNKASEDDFNAKRVCYSSDLARNLETVRVEGLANTQACSAVTPTNATLPAVSRKVSTQWHPDWRLPSKVAEPGRITTSIYNGQLDPFNGNAIASCAPSTALLPDGKPIAVLCKQVEQATTDANGSQGFSAALQSGVASRTQSWTYNQHGQVLTHNGPRTDVADVTTYAYYSDTTAEHTVGDLQSVTNPLGRLTTYTRYNRHGQLLQSLDPNGVSTTHTYDLRQRLLSTTIGGQSTTYAYDPVGQLTRVTHPDASYIGYEYDAAHRNTAVFDNRGNRIEYMLDNAGNRTAENVKDSSGALRRSLARSIDPLGRVQQTSGRE